MVKTFISLCCFSALLLMGCASTNQHSTPYFSTEDGYYTSSFPTRDVSTQLTSIQRSVQRFTSTTIYKTYFFDDKDITFEMFQKGDVDELASRKSTIDHSKAGTAIAILQNKQHLVFVTARHVLNAPDTLISYKEGPNIPENKYIQSAGIKIKQRNYLHTNNKFLGIDILATEKSYDLALIKIEREDNVFTAKPLGIHTGKAKNLKVGSFLYVVGYPLGSPMVTRGIVSAPDYDNRGNFLTDALFNHGISGGIIVASRDNFNTLEWVGMSLSASASEQYILVPDPSKQKQYNNLEAYTDTAFVSEKTIINYGVTQATPIEKILLFLFKNEDKLNKIGLSVTNLNGQQ